MDRRLEYRAQLTSRVPRSSAPAVEAIAPGADMMGRAMPDFRVLFAYVDPGTGSHILQLTLAGLLGGVGYTIRRRWARITALLGRSSALLADDAKR